MPNVCRAAGVRLAVLTSVVCLGGAPVWGQLHYGNPYDASMSRAPFGFPGWGARESLEAVSSFPEPVPGSGSGPSTISTDMLRHPLSSKARRLFEKAMHFAELGNHQAAITGLRDALAKCPSDAPYAQNLLGLEYIEVQQYTDAKASFTEAARLDASRIQQSFESGAFDGDCRGVGFGRAGRAQGSATGQIQR